MISGRSKNRANGNKLLMILIAVLIAVLTLMVLGAVVTGGGGSLFWGGMLFLAVIGEVFLVINSAGKLKLKKCPECGKKSALKLTDRVLISSRQIIGSVSVQSRSGKSYSVSAPQARCGFENTWECIYCGHKKTEEEETTF